jgi:HSP20 family protein
MKQVEESIESLFEISLVKSKYSEDEIVHYEWVPDVDIFEDEEKIVINTDLPEVDDKNVTIKYDNHMLILKGERKFKPETNIENYRRIERPYGAFLRKFAVPSNIDVDGIKAKRRGGVLKITLPKIKEGA